MRHSRIETSREALKETARRDARTGWAGRSLAGIRGVTPLQMARRAPAGSAVLLQGRGDCAETPALLVLTAPLLLLAPDLHVLVEDTAETPCLTLSSYLAVLNVQSREVLHHHHNRFCLLVIPPGVAPGNSSPPLFPLGEHLSLVAAGSTSGQEEGRQKD